MSEETIEPVGKTTHIIKFAAESLTILAIAGYAIGFVTVNSYLFKFGYSGHALLKTTYISAGMLFLSLVVPLALCISAIVLSGRKAVANPQDQISIFFTFNSFIILILLYIPFQTLFYISSDGIQSSFEENVLWQSVIFGVVTFMSLTIIVLEKVQSDWSLAVWAKKYPNLGVLLLLLLMFILRYKIEVVTFLVLAMIAVFFAMNFILDKQSLSSRLLERPHGVAIDLVLILGALLMAMGLFGVSVYPHIKPQYGGGQPSRVRVVIEEEKRNILSQGSGLKNIETMLADTQLIDSTEKELLLLLQSNYDDKGLLMQVDRSIVDAVIYLQPSPRNLW